MRSRLPAAVVLGLAVLVLPGCGSQSSSGLSNTDNAVTPGPPLPPVARDYAPATPSSYPRR